MTRIYGFAGGSFINAGASLVAVPDVVGDAQAAGTAELEGAGFLVSVETAYSSVVAVGLIISQLPTGGSNASSGSTVVITVSLGEAPTPPPSTDLPGAGGIWYEMELIRERAKRKKRTKEIEEEVEDIPEPVDREIATLMKVQEAKDDERSELSRLQALADKYAKPGAEVPRPILASVMKAHEERTKNALEQMQRQISQMLEEEEAAVISMLMLDD